MKFYTFGKFQAEFIQELLKAGFLPFFETDTAGNNWHFNWVLNAPCTCRRIPWYEAGYIEGLLKAGRKHPAKKFSFTYRYINDVISLDNISEFIDFIFPFELGMKDTTGLTSSKHN